MCGEHRTEIAFNWACAAAEAMVVRRTKAFAAHRHNVLASRMASKVAHKIEQQTSVRDSSVHCLAAEPRPGDDRRTCRPNSI